MTLINKFGISDEIQKVRTPKLKTIQLSLNITPFDLERKQKQALKFVHQGHQVKLRLFLNGRERDITSHYQCVEKLNNWFPKSEWGKYVYNSSMRAKSQNYFLFLKLPKNH